MRALPPLDIRDLGLMAYDRALTLQGELLEQRRAGAIADTLLLVEHPPVFTLGRRRGAADNILDPGDASVVQVSRGGDVTWHGPGQLVGYPIVQLMDGERDLHAVLRNLEGALIAVLQSHGVPAERKERHTGVWAQGKKLVSLGIAVRSWVTSHGFALNVNPDLSWFQRINPCGMDSGVMGSMATLGVDPIPTMALLKSEVATAVATAMGRTLSGR